MLRLCDASRVNNRVDEENRYLVPQTSSFVAGADVAGVVPEVTRPIAHVPLTIVSPSDFS